MPTDSCFVILSPIENQCVKGGGLIYINNKDQSLIKRAVPINRFLYSTTVQNFTHLSYSFRATTPIIGAGRWHGPTKWFHLYHLVIMGVPSALLQLSSLKNLSCLLRGFGEENLQTLNDVKNVSTNFYKLDFHTSNGEHAVLCLETSNLGSYYGINHRMSVKFSSHYGLLRSTYCWV